MLQAHFIRVDLKKPAVVCLDNSGGPQNQAIYLGKNRKLIKSFHLIEKIV